ncbi:MAG: hypothetical protein PHY48_05745 [Candidatus Cloacimonetes bacterium]|nr:hypothetical protein [Candidatus Cloacimonadota bacterium]
MIDKRNSITVLRVFSLCLILLSLILSACAAPKAEQEQSKLRSELKKWESFDSQGIVEISYMGLSLRKMFVASKNHEQLRLDIIDGGIMGAGAQPLISFYTGDYIALSSPFMPILEQLNPTDLIPSQSLLLFANTDSLFSLYGEEIMRSKKLEVDSLRISFLSDYRLDKVYDPKSLSEMKVSYGSNKKLAELEMTAAGNMSVKLIFDEIKYIEPQIIPLPKPQPGNSKPFEGLNLKQLLKDFTNTKS